MTPSLGAPAGPDPDGSPPGAPSAGAAPAALRYIASAALCWAAVRSDSPRVMASASPRSSAPLSVATAWSIPVRESGGSLSPFSLRNASAA